MMKVLFNGNLVDEPIPWSATDRAFSYGDGFFETMLFTEGKLPLLSFHKNRIERASALYHLSIPPREFDFLNDNIQTLIQINKMDADLFKAKLMIWRRASNSFGYRTSENQINWSLVVTPNQRSFLRNGSRLSISRDVRIPIQPWSGIKSINALPYILAGFECQERGLDDLILLNKDGIISECIESNIFWYYENEWQTPALSSGCVAGTMRGALLDQLNSGSAYVKEVMENEADFVPELAFTCNALGLTSIAEWNGTKIQEDIGFLQSCSQKLQIQA